MDEVILGKDDNYLVVLEGGFEEVRLVVSSYSVDARPLELCEKTPSRQIEPLDDKKDQEEVRQVVDDVEAPRSDNILSVRPRNVYSAS